MVRWLIASYIVLVLVLSAKAGAEVPKQTPNRSTSSVKKLNNQAESSEKLNVQDPLPDFETKSFRQIKFDSNTENFVG